MREFKMISTRNVRSNLTVALSVAAFCFGGAAAAHADSWGAIAVDLTKIEKSPYYGVGGGDSEAEATKNAMKFCAESGGESCKLATTYNQCGAYAASKVHGGWGKAPTKKEAEIQAKSGCGDEHCEVVVSDCN
jgi:hypothetical protein